MKLGFIGFGEVAYEMSRGFLSDGLQGIVAYDPIQYDEKYGALVRERAETANVTLLASVGDVVRYSDVVLSAVPGSRALQAADTALAYLNETNIYADISTSSPTTKKSIAELVAPTGAKFVDGALMGALTMQQHKVPTLVSGDGAKKFIEVMTPFNMSLDYVSDKAGDAIAVKLIRSIYTKGVATLEVEMLEAATKLQVEELVLQSVAKFSDSSPFLKMMNFLVTASAIHAGRQTHEMADCMTMLEDLGIDPIMTKATMLRMKWLAEKNLKEVFNGKVPEKWEDVITACAQ